MANVYVERSPYYHDGNQIGSGGWDMPQSMLLQKMEETDPRLVDAHHMYNHNIMPDEDYYKDYTRTEIVDRTLEEPWQESEFKRSSRPGVERINLTYKGTRSNTQALPRHPEQFYGFVGNDPRGASLDPRFDHMRNFMTSKAAELVVRMGKNDDQAIPESTWTNQSISYAKKEIFKRVRDSLKIFTPSKENFVRGQGALPKGTTGRPDRLVIQEDDEALDLHQHYENQPFRQGVTYRRDTWKHAAIDGELGVMNYGTISGNLKPGNNNRAIRKAAFDQDSKESEQGSVRGQPGPKGDVVLVKSMGGIDPATLESPLQMIEALTKLGPGKPQKQMSTVDLVVEDGVRDYVTAEGRVVGNPAPLTYPTSYAVKSNFEIGDHQSMEVKSYKSVKPGKNYMQIHQNHDSHFSDGNVTTQKSTKAPQRNPHSARTTSHELSFAEQIMTKQFKTSRPQFRGHDTKTAEYDNLFGTNDANFHIHPGHGASKKALRNNDDDREYIGDI